MYEQIGNKVYTRTPDGLVEVFDLIELVLDDIEFVQNKLNEGSLWVAFSGFKDLMGDWGRLSETDRKAAWDLFNEVTIGWAPDFTLHQFVLDW